MHLAYKLTKRKSLAGCVITKAILEDGSHMLCNWPDTGDMDLTGM